MDRARRAQPSINRLVTQRIDEKHLAIHRRALAKATSTVDNKVRRSCCMPCAGLPSRENDRVVLVPHLWSRGLTLL